MSELLFRTAARDDIAQVLANETAAYPVPWGKQALLDSLDEQYRFFLVELDKRIIGHLIFQQVLDECHLLNICLHPRNQGQGLGKTVIEFWIDVCKEQQCRELFLEVRVSNQKAIQLYRKFGFSVVCERKEYYRDLGGKRENGLIMTRLLSTISE